MPHSSRTASGLRVKKCRWLPSLRAAWQSPAPDKSRASSDLSAAEAVSEADAVMALLHKAVGLGYRSPDAFRTEDALDPLRDRDDFKLLILDLAMPADPFVGP
jgi:hypothetical protein